MDRQNGGIFESLCLIYVFITLEYTSFLDRTLVALMIVAIYVVDRFLKATRAQIYTTTLTQGTFRTSIG